VPSVPFRRLPFRDVPQAPRLPHPYDSTTAREVTVETRGFGRIRMHVREHGSGPPLLLVHGVMTSSYSFRYVLSKLGERHRLSRGAEEAAERAHALDAASRRGTLGRMLSRSSKALACILLVALGGLAIGGCEGCSKPQPPVTRLGPMAGGTA
jgi:hypothetical protein